MEYPTGAFNLCPLMVTGMMPLCLGGIFKGDFTTAMLCCCFQFLAQVKNDPSFCMNNCLPTYKLYDKEYLFCISKSNKISVSSNLSPMTKLWKNLKLAIQKFKVALPSEDIADPSTVFKCTEIMLYMLVWTSERAAPESIRALNLYLHPL